MIIRGKNRLLGEECDFECKGDEPKIMRVKGTSR